MRVLIIACIVVLNLAVISCGKDKPSDHTQKQQAQTLQFTSEPDIRVRAQTIKPKSIPYYVSMGARVQAASVAHVRPDSVGVVSRIQVREGARVTKGDILLYVDPSVAGKRYLPNPVTTPISGIVSSISVAVGNRVENTTQVASIVGDNSVELRASIPERYALYVREGLTGVFTPASVLSKDDARSVPVVIREASPVVNNKIGAVDVILAFTDKIPKSMVSGLFGKLTVSLDVYENQVVVPRNTVVTRRLPNGNQGQGVFVVASPEKKITEIEFRAVKIGIETDDEMQVIDGLKFGDVIVTLGQSHFFSKDVVVLQELDGITRTISYKEMRRGRNPDTKM